MNAALLRFRILWLAFDRRIFELCAPQIVSTSNQQITASRVLEIANRQRTKRVRLSLLRQIATHLLTKEVGLESWNLSLCLLAAPAMTHLNEAFVGHSGSTDVITFDYSEPSPAAGTDTLQGEIFICVDEALVQARKFRTSWQSELVRYLVHGVLHLRGFDDLQLGDRRRMKREENRLHSALAQRFALSRLALPSRKLP